LSIARSHTPGLATRESDFMSTLLLSADRLFDGTGAATTLHPTLHIRDGQIVEIGEGPVTRHEFPGCTILPGLIDTHVHLIFCAAETNEEVVEQVGQETDVELVHRALANARAALHAGVTTVRDCGGKGRLVQEVRDRIRRGDAEGADVLACGMPITTRSGHCWWLGLIAEGEAEAVRAGERMLSEGADFLKVMATGGNMTPSSNPMKAQYDKATLCRLADLGRSVKKHTAAHVLSKAGLPGAVAAAVRTIEHCDWRAEENRYEFDSELARQMRDQDQYVGFTLSGMARRSFISLGRNASHPTVHRLDARFEAERRTIEAGVKYTIHSDAGVRLTPIDRFALGLRSAVVELRLTPAEVILAATRSAAEAIGLPDRGTLVPGKRADLLVVEGNPLTDLSCLEKVRGVMKAGRWVRPSFSTPAGLSGPSRR
jgi:imidazolonepropionase-like amidohydrolase